MRRRGKLESLSTYAFTVLIPPRSSGVVAQLSEDYRPNAEALCIGILETLSSAEKQDADDSGWCLYRVLNTANFA
jgi:hypothetical protein